MKPWRLAIAIFFDDLSHGNLDFFVGQRESPNWDTIWVDFRGHYERKHKNEHEEAAQAQPNKNICKNKTACQFSSQSVD